MKTKIFLAATSHVKSPIVERGLHPHYILESYMDLKSGTKSTDKYIKWCLTADEFLLDSGAFAFMNKASKIKDLTEDNIKQYIRNYVDFINKYNIKYFFEMDLDCVLGYEKVKKIRNYLERKTGKKPIPVWHITRGIEDFHEMCKNYDYVAIGGIASKEFPKKDHDKLWELCDIAHSYGCKIHGLGYLPLKVLNEGTCPFDTVDGTSWQGHMRGQCFKQKDKAIEKYKDSRYWKDIAYDCFKAWTDFSKEIE